MKKDIKVSGLKKKPAKSANSVIKDAKKKKTALKETKKESELSKKDKSTKKVLLKNKPLKVAEKSKTLVKKIGLKASPVKKAKAIPAKAKSKTEIKKSPEKPKAKVLTKNVKAKEPSNKKIAVQKPSPVKKEKVPLKVIKSQSNVASKKSLVKNKTKDTVSIVEKSIKTVKKVGKKVVDKVTELLPINKEKEQTKIQAAALSDEPEPEAHELEPLDLIEIVEKPKKAKSKKGRKKHDDDDDDDVSSQIRRMPLPDLSAINYNNFKKSEKPTPVKIEAQPSVLIKTEVKKAEPKKADIKTRIFEKCLTMQTNSVSIAKKAMDDAQESANEEKGSMEEKFDSFRESMHITRDMYARQFQEGMNSLSMLKRINPNLEHNTVILGSVVYTEFQNYFVSVSLGEVVIDDDKFITISTSTPLFQALSGKSKGDTFKFRDKVYTIIDVF